MKVTIIKCIFCLDGQNIFLTVTQQRFLNGQWHQDIRAATKTKNAKISDGIIDRWIQGLAQAYNDMARHEYPSLTPRDLVNYLTEKEQRNQNSHFRDKLKEVIEENPNISMNDFITNQEQLSNVFHPTEINLLSQTFGKYCRYLNSKMKLVLNPPQKLFHLLILLTTL